MLSLIIFFFLFLITYSAAEFVVYKLKEMGKISGEDVSLLVERFRILDADQSGTLTAADINLTQSSRK